MVTFCLPEDVAIGDVSPVSCSAVPRLLGRRPLSSVRRPAPREPVAAAAALRSQYMLANGKLKPSPARLAALWDAWGNLTGPGPTLSAAQRIGIIASARAGWAGAAVPGANHTEAGDSGLDSLLAEAAHWLAVDAGGITGEVVAELEARGLDRFRYLETVGVVARLANVDFYLRGIGAGLFEVTVDGTSRPGGSEPEDRQPTGDYLADAGLTDGWVPATGPLIAPFTLDALPSEGEALRAIHEPMYMPMNEMGDHRYTDVLTRAQIEFVASRTSYLNECFY